MHTLAHRSLRFMLLLMVHPLTHVVFLDIRGARLEGRQIDGVGVHEIFRHGYDIRDETVQQVNGHAFSNDDAEDLGLVFGRGERVICACQY